MSQPPVVLENTPLEDSKAKWVGLRRILYRDSSGQERVWESAERKTRSGSCDAVCIVALLRSADDATGDEAVPRIVLVRQFRPPLGAKCIECPAGLMDKNETYAETATRELREETGYHGTVARVSPVVHSDPGFGNANMAFVYVDVDMKDPRNRHPVAAPDEGEDIEVLLVPIQELSAKLEGYVAQGDGVDARLQMFADGLCMFGQNGLWHWAKP
ncbi:NUDIX hydrolase domain-like protein [Thamnocephalis sphaerospora]|uniref:NUDIX hydrolase domain-like protein n=1 Tax=Thamnocephalis sphaerospora TaxID=78915 RepID=A0A4P9XSE4_9FUNG|nr:NUDIX hydrolase domain-like protein [Thamnocephalis sphaerospora]|eukprot:RKP08270.1 NUDIX hydrolase domain-like protein [Thamnocephalis sphaerospora]